VSGTYVIRPADPGHVVLLPEIERAAATRFGDSIPESVLSSVTPLASLSAAQASGLLWVALAPDGRPVGFGMAGVYGRRVHLEELDVLPEHGRRGLGTALVAAIERWGKAHGFIEMTLTTYRDVPWNDRFYEGIGFRAVAEDDLDAELHRRLAAEAAWGLERSRRVAMRKPLGAS
jgi:GNAT superfamily N-acetyltransferase